MDFAVFVSYWDIGGMLSGNKLVLRWLRHTFERGNKEDRNLLNQYDRMAVSQESSSVG